MTMKKSELELNWPEQRWLLGYVTDHTCFTSAVQEGRVRPEAMEHLMQKMEGAYGGYQGILDFLWVLREHGRQRAAEFVNDFRDDLSHRGLGVQLLRFDDEQEREDWLNGTGEWAEVVE